MFRVTSNKGFHLIFPNELTLSTQFGGGNYCANYDEIVIGEEKHMHRVESIDAEIAIWDKNNIWLTGKMSQELFGEDEGDVMGRVKVEEWLKILDWCRAYKCE